VSYGKLLVALVAAAVAIAFADSSIVVLALPELYARFQHDDRGRRLGGDRLQRRGGDNGPRPRPVRSPDQRRAGARCRALRLPRSVDCLRGRGQPAFPHRDEDRARRGSGIAARGLAAGAGGADRLVGCRRKPLDARWDLRRGARAGSRGRADPGLRLACDLRRSGAAGRARAACHPSCPSTRRRGGRLELLAPAHTAGEPLPRAPVWRARGGSFPGRPARDHGVGLLADRRGGDRERSAWGCAGGAAARAPATPDGCGLRRGDAARRRAPRPRPASFGERRPGCLRARALRCRAGTRSAAALTGGARPARGAGAQRNPERRCTPSGARAGPGLDRAAAGLGGPEGR